MFSFAVQISVLPEFKKEPPLLADPWTQNRDPELTFESIGQDCFSVDPQTALLLTVVTKKRENRREISTLLDIGHLIYLDKKAVSVTLFSLTGEYRLERSIPRTEGKNNEVP